MPSVIKSDQVVSEGNIKFQKVYDDEIQDSLVSTTVKLDGYNEFEGTCYNRNLSYQYITNFAIKSDEAIIDSYWF